MSYNNDDDREPAVWEVVLLLSLGCVIGAAVLWALVVEFFV